MNHLNRLIYKAQNWQDKHKEGLSVAFINDNDNGTYGLSCQLWNGIPYHDGAVIESNHQTLEEAYARFDELAEQYSGSMDPLCITVDYGEELILSQSADI